MSNKIDPRIIAAARGIWEKKLARHNQLPPPDYSWITWVLLAGRGFGKTRTAAEWCVYRMLLNSNILGVMIHRTFAEGRAIAFEGSNSGLLSIFKRYGLVEGNGLTYTSSSPVTIKLWNGSSIRLATADQPKSLRGIEANFLWFDEFASMDYLQLVWETAEFGLRQGAYPQRIITTTPTSNPLFTQLLNEEQTIVTRGSTFDNRANLPPSQLAAWEEKYAGTRLGRQELEGEILDDVPGALWSYQMIEDARQLLPTEPVRVVVGVDPAGSITGDMTGIVVAAKLGNDKFAILGDYSFNGSPNEWAKKVTYVYHKYKADLIVIEDNYGGNMGKALLKTIDKDLPIKTVHAKQGKRLRAEPISMLYEQDKVLHDKSNLYLGELEKQMTTWVPGSGESPDRVDAMVHAVTELMKRPQATSTYRAERSWKCEQCEFSNGLDRTVCRSCNAARLAMAEV